MTPRERYKQLRLLPVRSIAVWRPLKLGDFLVMTPALRALRAAFPKAKIDYIGLPAMRELAERYPYYINEFVSFPGWPGLPETPWNPISCMRFLANMQARRYDLMLQMQGNGTIVNSIMAVCGARRIAGFAVPSSYRPDDGWFMDYPEGQHEIIRLLRLCEHLGISHQGKHMEFPVTTSDEQQLYQTIRPKGAYLCMHAGASSSRPWNPQYFAQVADFCYSELGLHVIFTGSSTEGRVVEQVTRSMRSPSLNLTGKTTLGMLGALLHGARLYIGNDTGVSHMSTALGVPGVIVFTTADPKRWAPLGAAQIASTARETTPELVCSYIKRLFAGRRQYVAPQNTHLAHSW